MVKIKNTDHISYWLGCGRNGTIFTLLGGKDSNFLEKKLKCLAIL